MPHRHRPAPADAAPPHAAGRRRWLGQAGGGLLAILGLPPLLSACGGGGGDAAAGSGATQPTPPAPPPNLPAVPTGLLAYRNNSAAARRDTDRLGHPCLSPDGRWLAVHALAGPSATRNVSTTLPHVLPFDPAGAVLVDSARHALARPAIVDCGGQMVWLR